MTDQKPSKLLMSVSHIMENLSGQAEKLELYIVLQNFVDV